MFFHQGAQLAELFTQVSDRLRMFGLGTWGQGVGLGGVFDHRGFLHSKGWLGPSFDGFQLLGLQGLGGGLLNSTHKQTNDLQTSHFHFPLSLSSQSFFSLTVFTVVTTFYQV